MAPRLEAISLAIQSLIAGDFPTRIKISDKSDELDEIAGGINMLAEKLGNPDKDHVKSKVEREQEKEKKKEEELTDKHTELEETRMKYREAKASYHHMEEQLILDRQLFESFMEHLPAIAYIKDINGRYEFVNKGFLEGFESLTGKVLEDWRRKTDKEILPWEIAEEFVKNDERILKKKKKLEFIELAPLSSGLRYYLSHKFPILDMDKTVKYVAGISIDITEQKRIEEEIRTVNGNLLLRNKINMAANQSENLKAILHMMAEILMQRLQGNVAFFLLDEGGKSMQQTYMSVEKGKLKRISDLLKKEISYPVIPSESFTLYNEVRKSGKYKLVEDAAQIIQYLEEYLIASNFIGTRSKKIINGLARGIYKILGIQSIMIVHLRSEKRDIGFLHISSKGKFTDDDIRLVEDLGQDISLIVARKQAEEALQETENKYRILFNQAPNPIVIIDPDDGVIVECNTQAEKSLGYFPGEIHGHKLSDFYTSFPDAEIEKLLVQGQEGDTSEFETKARTKNGEFRDFNFSLSLVTLYGKPHIQIIGSDITELKKREKELLNYKNQLEEKVKQRTQELTESETKQRALFENAGQAIAYYTIDGKIISFNRIAANNMGGQPEDFAGKTMADLFGTEAGALYQERIDKAVRELKPGIYEDQVSLPIGQGYYLSTYQYICGDDHTWEGVQIISTDITHLKETEKLLRESEEKFRTLAQISPVGIFRMDPLGNALFVNDRWCEISGRTHEEALAGGWREAIHPDDRDRINDHWHSFIRDGLPFRVEHRFIHKDGQIKWILGQSVAEEGEDGNITGYLGILTDITEQKRDKTRLEESIKISRALLNAPSEMFFLHDRKGSIMDMNAAFCQRFGKTYEELIHTNVFDLAAPDYVKNIKSEIEKVCRTGNRVQFSVENDGRYLENSLYPVMDSDGNVIMIAVFVHNVSKLKKTEHELQLSNKKLEIKVEKRTAKLQETNQKLLHEIEERKEAEKNAKENGKQYRLLIENIPDIVYSYSKNKGAAYWSPRAQKVMGFSLSQLCESPFLWTDSIHPEDKKEVLKAITNTSEGKKYNLEYRILDTWGNWHWFQDRSTQIKVDADDVFIEGVATDITERKSAELAVKERLEDLSLINSLNAMANEGAELDRITQTLLEKSREIFPPFGMILYQLDEEKKYLILKNLSPFGNFLQKVEDLVKVKISDMIRILPAPGSLMHKIMNSSTSQIYRAPADIKAWIREHVNDPERFGPRIQQHLKKLVPLFRKLLGQTSLYAKSMRTGDQTLGLISIVTTVELTDNEITRLDQFVTQFTNLVYQVNTQEKLKSSYNELRVMTSHLESVREDERLNISREIHDELGQILSALRMDISIHKQNLNKTVHTPDLKTYKKDAESMISLVDRSIAAVREIVRQLRPEMLEKLGIIDTLRSYLEDFENRTGIECIFHSEISEMKLKNEVKLTIFRIFQEALTNILRHAEATKVEVNIDLQQNFMILVMKDNGKGFNKKTVEPKESFGILGMKERAVLINGKFSIHGERNKGTAITVNIPL